MVMILVLWVVQVVQLALPQQSFPIFTVTVLVGFFSCFADSIRGGEASGGEQVGASENQGFRGLGFRVTVLHFLKLPSDVEVTA